MLGFRRGAADRSSDRTPAGPREEPPLELPDGAVRVHATGLTVYGRDFPAPLDLDPERVRGHVEWLEEGIRGNRGALQEFLNGYYGTGAHRTDSFLRFALSVELVDRYCPEGGRWFDAGSFGHDALRVREIRPDVRCTLASYEGGVMTRNEDGLHFWSGDGPPPEVRVTVERSDLERDRWPVADGELDLVTCFEVIEHFKFTPLTFVLEANRTLKTGGRLVISTPNGASARAAAQIALGQHPAECPVYHRQDEYGRVHPLEYSRAQLADLLTRHGFELDLLCSVNLSPFDERERRAIRALRELRAGNGTARPAETAGPPENAGPLEPGQKWLVVATRAAEVRERSYPASLFA